jgi:hypothetical protein
MEPFLFEEYDSQDVKNVASEGETRRISAKNRSLLNVK